MKQSNIWNLSARQLVIAVSEQLEQRVEKLEEVVEGLTKQMQSLVDTVDKLNKNQMSNTYVRMVREGRLEEMREEYPDMVKDLEQTAQNFIAPKIEELEDSKGTPGDDQ